MQDILECHFIGGHNKVVCAYLGTLQVQLRKFLPCGSIAFARLQLRDNYFAAMSRLYGLENPCQFIDYKFFHQVSQLSLSMEQLFYEHFIG